MGSHVLTMAKKKKNHFEWSPAWNSTLAFYLASILTWHSIWHRFWRFIWQYSDILPDILSDICSDILPGNLSGNLSLTASKARVQACPTASKARHMARIRSHAQWGKVGQKTCVGFLTEWDNTLGILPRLNSWTRPRLPGLANEHSYWKWPVLQSWFTSFILSWLMTL